MLRFKSYWKEKLQKYLHEYYSIRMQLEDGIGLSRRANIIQPQNDIYITQNTPQSR